ncbi:MAG: hypothetical protein ACK4RK_12915 [Gemmataceae bacterium]
MVRWSKVLLMGLLLAVCGALWAADDGPAGTYKFTFTAQGQTRTFWLVQLEEKNGQWTGTVVSTQEGIPPTTIDGLQVDGDRVRFQLSVQGEQFSFDGRLPKEKGKPILGSFELGGRLFLAELAPTKLKKIDRFELNKEILDTAQGERVWETALGLLQEAEDRKTSAEDVRGWADKAYKAAEPYGARMQRIVALRMAESLLDQDDYTPVALEYARRADRLLDASDNAEDQTRTLQLLASALKKANLPDDVKQVEARLVKLESKLDEDYLKKMPPFKPDTYAGRKGKSDRVVLVELFTGAQCPPCVAADLAFDAIDKTYKPTDVVLLQYHLHIPGPDPLTNPDTVARSDFYGEEIEGTPTIFFNGKPRASGGGGVDDSEEKYQQYRKVIDPLLETTTPIHLKADVKRAGDKLTIAATASDIAKPSDQLRLRLALAEKQVRYTGSNGLRFHHQVVRAMPGGVDGFPLEKKEVRQEVTVDLNDLRKEITAYLNAYGMRRPFPNSNRPLDFKDLRVIAFVQDDGTKEVLQAVEVEVPEK